MRIRAAPASRRALLRQGGVPMGQFAPYQMDSSVKIKLAAPAHILSLADSNNVLLAFYESLRFRMMRPTLTGVGIVLADIVLTGVDIVLTGADNVSTGREQC
jgi:hypothetical protein